MATVVRDVGGDFLGKWTVFAIGFSNLALFEAGDGCATIVTKFLSRFGTPTAGILTGTMFVIVSR